MCLILLAWQTHPQFPLIVAANRDEFYPRRTARADFWPAHPQVLAGRDLEAIGTLGTWLGLTRQGRFAALTNYRDPSRHKADAPSRGRLVADFLCGHDPIDAYLDSLEAADYNGFNLLLGDGQRLVAFSNITRQRHKLAPGIYGLSNATLDTPWPKVGAGKTALAHALATLPDETALQHLLRDDRIHPDIALPATGVPLTWERLLSAAFIRSPDYGTRCSTLIKVGADGTASFDEQTWLPGGIAGARCRYRFELEKN
ncbi:MAG: NRDE family protein [Rhodocyclaceae bacterium]|nr:NRDE family protein [Rhodocyclaceae bacterium]MDZ4214546.1 NRDE family protein [Rhodocyclaceae bacterium]